MNVSKYWIAHRGNIAGPNAAKENQPEYVNEALRRDFQVLVDVWYVNGEWMLGSQSPDIHIELVFLKNKSIWCHAKNTEALRMLESLGDKVNLFTYDGKIIMLPEKVEPTCTEEELNNNYVGMCSDYVYYYRATFEGLISSKQDANLM